VLRMLRAYLALGGPPANGTVNTTSSSNGAGANPYTLPLRRQRRWACQCSIHDSMVLLSQVVLLRYRHWYN
jgi:hypothetical protein